MRAQLLCAMALLAGSSFLSAGPRNTTSITDPDHLPEAYFCRTLVAFTVHRLSGDRVMVSWHTEGEPASVRYEVLRQHGHRQVFLSLGPVSPAENGNSSADYSFLDLNAFPDSSFYCLKKTTPDDVIFYSLTKGVEGVERQR